MDKELEKMKKEWTKQACSISLKKDANTEDIKVEANGLGIVIKLMNLSMLLHSLLNQMNVSKEDFEAIDESMSVISSMSIVERITKIGDDFLAQQKGKQKK